MIVAALLTIMRSLRYDQAMSVIKEANEADRIEEQRWST